MTAFSRACVLSLALTGAALAQTSAERIAADREARTAWRAARVELTGHVVDEQGLGVRAQVSVGGATATCDRTGHFRLEGLPRRNALLAVEFAGSFAEIRAVELALPAGEAVADAGLIRLRARRPGRARMIFGGDSMMGRRFLDPDNSEAPRPALLRKGHLLSDARKVLSSVAPIVRAADLAVVNLETVLTRGDGHPVSKKTYSFWSPPETLDALSWAGVDAVTLGNNHCWDYGAAGLRRTISEIERRKILHCGAGLDEARATLPASLRAGGETWRLLSYSGIRGSDVRLQARGRRGGAAALKESSVRADVAREAREGAVIVAMHAGDEYSEGPTARNRACAHAAAESGASLVVGHHPHSLQGFALDDGCLVAWSLGNFVFDQSRWESLPSALLLVDFEDGRVAGASLIPIVSDGCRPVPAAGAPAQAIVRRAAALSPGLPVYWSSGRGVIAIDEPHAFSTTTRHVYPPGTPVPLATPDPAAFLVAAETDGGTLQLGRDLLRIGGFEDGDADDRTLESDVWILGEPRRVSPVAPRSGTAALRLLRDAGQRPVAVSTRLRIPVPAAFTVTGWIRAENAGPFSLQADWCRDLEMRPFARTTLGSSSPSTPGWTRFSFDVTRPDDAFSLRLRLVLAAPENGSGEATIDDLAVIAWSDAGPGSPARPDWTHARIAGASADSTVRLEWIHFREP